MGDSPRCDGLQFSPDLAAGIRRAKAAAVSLNRDPELNAMRRRRQTSNSRASFAPCGRCAKTAGSAQESATRNDSLMHRSRNMAAGETPRNQYSCQYFLSGCDYEFQQDRLILPL